MKWDIDRIREVMKKLDEKTGLNGSSLDIIISGRLTSTRGRFNYYSMGSKKNYHVLLNEKMTFVFAKMALDGRFDDQAVIDLIHHEYMHYYCAVTYPKIKVGHGPQFKLACAKFSVNDSTYFNAKLREDFNEKKAYQKCYIITCNNCKEEYVRVKKSSSIKNIEDYRCSTCKGKLSYHIDYRILD